MLSYHVKKVKPILCNLVHIYANKPGIVRENDAGNLRTMARGYRAERRHFYSLSSWMSFSSIQEVVG